MRSKSFCVLEGRRISAVRGDGFGFKTDTRHVLPASYLTPDETRTTPKFPASPASHSSASGAASL